MNKTEALADADRWEADIVSGRAGITTGLETAMSKARATAGASGVRKGTQSWDTMMAQARSPYDQLNATYNNEAIQLEAYRSNVRAIQEHVKPAFATKQNEGGNDPGSSPEPGAGYSEPTTEFGKGLNAAANVAATEFVGTVAAATTAAGAFSLGAGKYSGPVGNLLGTFAAAALNPSKFEELVEDSFGLMGVDKSLGSNLKGVSHLGAMAVGVYGAVNTVKGVVGHMQAGTLDDAFFETVDTMATAIDGGMNPSSGRAGRQSDAQAAENASQGLGAPDTSYGGGYGPGASGTAEHGETGSNTEGGQEGMGGAGGSANDEGMGADDESGGPGGV